MRKHKEILRLHYDCGWSMRLIAEVVGASAGTVHNVLTQAGRVELSWPLAEDMDEDELSRVLYPRTDHSEHPDEVNFAWVRDQLSLKSVTLKLLWMELCEQQGYHHSYGWFCRCYKAWAKDGKRSMRMDHVAGDIAYVDYSGLTVVIGERKAQIFVGALGVSHYTFVCAVWTQSLEDWLECNTQMLEYFGAVPNLIVPDNLKSAITKACRYDPDANGAYQQWAAHYGVAVMPTRPRRPKDKAVAENSVQQVQRWILAPLRDHRFESLSQLNREIRKLLEQLNSKPFSERPGSRREIFESVDRPAMRPLPLMPFHALDIKTAKVGIDYHVQLDRHWYSVPHELVGKQVEIRADTDVVTVFFKGRQVCMHVKQSHYGHSTMDSHMPQAHEFMKKWTPERVERWAAEVGEDCLAWIQARISEVQHFHQVSRKAMGVLSLSRKHGRARLNAACRIANQEGLDRYGQIAEILKNGADLRCQSAELDLQLPQDHENLRGAHHFK